MRSQRSRTRQSNRQVYVHLMDFMGHDAVGLVSRQIGIWMSHGGQERTIRNLAKQSGLHYKTVHNIYWRLTSEPRLSTVIILMSALGFRAMTMESEDVITESAGARRGAERRVAAAKDGSGAVAHSSGAR